MISDGSPIAEKIATVQIYLFIERASDDEFMKTQVFSNTCVAFSSFCISMMHYLWSCERFWDQGIVQQTFIIFLEKKMICQ